MEHHSETVDQFKVRHSTSTNKQTNLTTDITKKESKVVTGLLSMDLVRHVVVENDQSDQIISHELCHVCGFGEGGPHVGKCCLHFCFEFGGVRMRWETSA